MRKRTEGTIVGGRLGVIVLALLLCGAGSAVAGTFKDLVGPASVAPVAQTSPLMVPFITWGGDMATFYANGGLKTAPGTIYHQLGLNLELKAGDDFVQQVRDYMSGKSPFLRGTFRMIGMASEVIGSDPRTQGKVILQLTWSAGDHMVGRKGLHSLNDLKEYLERNKRKPTIVLQEGGPHVGMLDDLLGDVKMAWSDINVIWAKDLTATDNSPVAMFRKDPKIDACFVIDPDMTALTGGLTKVGTGAEGTVQGARVTASTAYRTRTIADVYVCRKDFFDANKELVTKFVNGYLKACEEVTELRKQYEAKERGVAADKAKYMVLLKLTQTILTPQVIPTLEDAHGLLVGCTFVLYPGNVFFFTEPNNPTGFDAFMKKSLDLAITLGIARERKTLLAAWSELEEVALKKGLARTEKPKIRIFKAEMPPKEDEVEARTLVSFNISFSPNQDDFPPAQYAEDYDNVVKMARQYGNASFVIRGHADPSKVLQEVVRAGTKKGVIERKGAAPDWKYIVQGQSLDLADTKAIMKLVESSALDGVPEIDPRGTMAEALTLSLSRAEKVRDSIAEYLQGKGISIEKDKIPVQGVGIAEPRLAVPRNMDQARQNMRVEFRLLRPSAEAATSGVIEY